MHVLIHEPNFSGHRFTTVRVLIDSLLTLNSQFNVISKLTLATTDAAVISDEFVEQLAQFSDQIEIYRLPNTNTSHNPVVKTHHQLMGLRKCLQEVEVDHLYMPYTDHQLQLLTIYKFLPGVNWWPPKPVTEVQIMLSKFAYPFTRKMSKVLSLIAVKYCGAERVHLNDTFAIDYLKLHHPSNIAHVYNIPDPITKTITIDKSSARDYFQLPHDIRIIGLLGVLDERKGTDILVEAFSQASLRESDILLLAGRLSPSIRSLVDSKNDNRIVCLDRYLSEEELSNAISAMDLVVAPYQQIVGSASIIIRAAISNRMVLSADTGWAGAIIPKYQLGMTSSVKDIKAFSKSLETAIDQAQTFTTGRAAENFILYNSEQNVQDHWISLIKKRLGLPSNSESLNTNEI